MPDEVPKLVIVFLCVLGAGAVVTVCAAFSKMMFGRKGEDTERNFNQRSPEQDSHLRRVREINQLAIFSQVRSQRKEARRQRERDASDIEIQSSRSHSNLGHFGRGGQGTSLGGYHPSQYSGTGMDQPQYGYGNNSRAAPVAYYEEDYAEHENSAVGYDEQQYVQQQYYAQANLSHQQQQQQSPQRLYQGGYSSPYMIHHNKSGPLETWSEVPR